MNSIKYIAKVLPDGHLSLPEEIREKMGLILATANEKHFMMFEEIEKEYVRED